MLKILVADAINISDLLDINSNDSFHLVEVNSENIQKEIIDADALLVRSRTQVDHRLIFQAQKMRFIGRAGVGIDNIDVVQASKSGIFISNVPGGNSISAAEHTVALMLCLARKIPQAHQSMVASQWNRSMFIGSELHGKVLGLIGFGRIGKLVSNISSALGMKIHIYDPYISSEYIKSLGYIPSSFDHLIKFSDYISLHVPLTEKTSALINKDVIKNMKSTACLVNCARGGLIHHSDLHEALLNRKIQAAALDVFEIEPPRLAHSFLQLNNLVLTPHLGASTKEANSKVASEMATIVKDYFLHNDIRNCVNVISLDSHGLKKIENLIKLSKKLGMFLKQFYPNAIITDVNFTASSKLYKKELDILSLYMLLGIFHDWKDVNLVNISFIAKDNNINVNSTASSDITDLNFLNVSLKSNCGSISVSGIVSEDCLRIVSINQFSINIPINGYLLIVFYHDHPGMIGVLGTILGQYNINIAELHIERKNVGEEAIAVFNVDSSLSDEILQEICKLKKVIQFSFVNIC